MRSNSKYRLSGNGVTKAAGGFKADDAGSLTVFGLFIFLMILMISGLAVDMMRYEHQRVGVQNTLDTAVVAATRLNQDANTNAKVEALVKDYFTKAGYDPDIVTVVPNIEIPAGGDEETLRTVSAVVDFDMDTAFMNMLGIDSLPGIVGGGAREGQQLTEVALVLDISGSMGWGTKLEEMKSAAKSFVTTLIQNNGEDRVMISIIPYNGQVQISEDLVARIDKDLEGAFTWDNTYTEYDPAPAHPGAVAAFNTHNPNARCATFLDADFDHRTLSATGDLNPSAKFSDRDRDYAQPSARNFWCGEGYPEVLLYQNNELKLHEYIDSLTASGWTAIDYGMKWAVGVLDPEFRPIVQDMLADTNDPDLSVDLVPQNVAGHPVDYGTPNVFKYVVLMTDGANTRHNDLKDEFKSGPTRIWYSEELGEDDEYDGFLVEMPENAASQRWYRPKSPFGTDDDEYLSETDFESTIDPDKVKQWTYHRLYERFTVKDAAEFFFQHSDSDAYTAHRNAVEDTGSNGTADGRLARICDKAIDHMTVYAVAFEAPDGGVQALQDCVLRTPGNFFQTTGDQLTKTFEAIAAEITKLRLTQ